MNFNSFNLILNMNSILRNEKKNPCKMILSDANLKTYICNIMGKLEVFNFNKTINKNQIFKKLINLNMNTTNTYIINSVLNHNLSSNTKIIVLAVVLIFVVLLFLILIILIVFKFKKKKRIDGMIALDSLNIHDE